MKPFIVMDILKEAKKYKDVIHLEIGEPDLLPPPKVKEALIKAINSNKFYYTPANGLQELREKIARHYKIFYDTDINPENILVTTGTSSAFLIAFYFAKKIASFSPTYPCYPNFAELENKEFITINSLSEKEYDTLMISSPNNPTSEVIDNEKLKKICEFTQKNDKLLISDELYHGLVYEKDYTTAIKFNKNAIVINGFSKFFCMPGFRLGWIILPDNLIREAEIIAQNILISAPTLSQYAAIEAFDYEYLEKIKNEFKKRRDFIYENLKDVFECKKADGAFYLWCDISKYSNDSLEFSKKLLKNAKVAITPGIDFGDYENFVRIAFTKDIKTLEEGVKRIKKFLKNYC